MFITFEGTEGAGKTTQARLLVDTLRTMTDVTATREPGGTPAGEALREILLNGPAMSSLAEAFLVSAARAAVVNDIIRPALVSGQIVVCDRYVDTTLVIQGYGFGNNVRDLRHLCAISTGGLMPDLTILLDIDPAVGVQRKREQNDYNAMDERGLLLGERYRQGYRELMLVDPGRWAYVAVTGRTPDDIAQQILSRVIAHAKFPKEAMLKDLVI